MSRTVRLLAIFVALALVGAACGDDAGTTTTTTAPNATVTAATSAPTTATTSAETSTTGGEGDGEEADAIEDLLSRFADSPLRATYVVDEGDDATTVILSQDPTADPPIEAITVVEADTKIIIGAGQTILCDEGLCFELPEGGDGGLAIGLLGPISATLLAATPGGLEGVEVSEEPVNVAGRDGVCFTLPANSDTGLVRQCIDNDLGFTLLLQTGSAEGELETVMELVDFSGPIPEDFEPTGPVTATP